MNCVTFILLTGGQKTPTGATESLTGELISLAAIAASLSDQVLVLHKKTYLTY
jgi:hypothetical protein